MSFRFRGYLRYWPKEEVDPYCVIQKHNVLCDVEWQPLPQMWGIVNGGSTAGCSNATTFLFQTTVHDTGFPLLVGYRRVLKKEIKKFKNSTDW